MATSEELTEAYNRGRSAGAQWATNKQPRVVTPAMYNDYLGPYQGDAGARNAFDQGFYQGYDAAAAGMGVVGPGGKTATTVLSDVTKKELGKADNPFGAQQTELALDYKAFDGLVSDDLALESAPSGPSFLERWHAVKAEFDARNLGPMSDVEIADSSIKLEGAKAEREAILGGAEGYGTYATIPTPGTEPGISTWETLPSYEMPAGGPKPSAPLVKPGAPASPAAAGLFGLSRGATIALGVVSVGAIGAGIWYATRDKHKNMVLGPDGIWRPKPKGAL